MRAGSGRAAPNEIATFGNIRNNLPRLHDQLKLGMWHATFDTCALLKSLAGARAARLSGLLVLHSLHRYRFWLLCFVKFSTRNCCPDPESGQQTHLAYEFTSATYIAFAAAAYAPGAKTASIRCPRQRCENKKKKEKRMKNIIHWLHAHVHCARTTAPSITWSTARSAATTRAALT